MALNRQRTCRVHIKRNLRGKPNQNQTKDRDVFRRSLMPQSARDKETLHFCFQNNGVSIGKGPK